MRAANMPTQGTIITDTTLPDVLRNTATLDQVNNVMALIKKQSKVSDKIPTSSMADIAFLLLIFFLVTTVFDEEIGLQVVLPERSPESEQEVSPKNLLFFLVQPDGSVVVRRGESPMRAADHRAPGGGRDAAGAAATRTSSAWCRRRRRHGTST
jgi:hypothetical protein